MQNPSSRICDESGARDSSQVLDDMRIDVDVDVGVRVDVGVIGDGDGDVEP
jgi:hypothetical protein